MSKWGTFEVIQGFYLSHIVYHLHHFKVFAQLDGHTTVDEVASRLEYDSALLKILLDFVFQTSDIIRRNRDGQYKLNEKLRSYTEFGFHLDKLIGAYGPAFTQLDQVLHSSTLGRNFVDSKMLAQAFAQIKSSGQSVSAQIIIAEEVHSLLDLGCGTGTLLSELCSLDATFRGWGIDKNAAMCLEAKQKLIANGFHDRVDIINADVENLENHFPVEQRDRIAALHCSSLLNEYFRFGLNEIVNFISKLKILFPNRLLFVIDYYGKLTHEKQIPLRYRHTLVHDAAQAVSGQGVPLPNAQSWALIYLAAGCQLIQTYNGENNGIQWFAHIIQL